jgi:Holin of 3TMs, for gene-transfer release
MSIDIKTPWQSIIDTVGGIISKVVPDRAAAAAATAQLAQMAQAGQLQEELLALQATTSAQTDINKVEAASPNWFIAGGRPAVIWICAGALALNLVLGPLFTWAAALAGHPTPFPVLDPNLLMALLFPLLGLGAARTIEKLNGAAGNH